ncbi:MAG: TlpA disulfide reductase family protein [Bacteroidales bacterium]|nr:TlpA disulfide reductase family protein [Bacteroidales bacterium]
MKKISLLFTLFIAFLAFSSCSSKSELVIEVPELSQGEITIIYATPDQIDSRQQETLKTVQITNGKAQIVFDTISFDKKIKDCTMIISSASNQFATTIPLPLEKGETLTIKISGIDKYIKREDFLKTTYSGSKKAESFSKFYNDLMEQNRLLIKNPQTSKDIYTKQSELYKTYISENSESGLVYSLLIGQLMQFKLNDQNPIIDLCSNLCLSVEEGNIWANYLCKILAERQKRAFSSSILSFNAIDKDEKEYTERDIKPHKYVLVCFWASWCKPCKEELPQLKKLYEKYNSKGLEIVSISVDLQPMEWLEFTKTNPLPWLSLWGNGHELTAKYDFQTIPFNIIADENGKVIKRELYKEEIDKAIEELFDE